jgi:hypothetical protein
MQWSIHHPSSTIHRLCKRGVIHSGPEHEGENSNETLLPYYRMEGIIATEILLSLRTSDLKEARHQNVRFGKPPGLQPYVIFGLRL